METRFLDKLEMTKRLPNHMDIAKSKKKIDAIRFLENAKKLKMVLTH